MAVNEWHPMSQARRDGTRYILFAPNTRLGVYTGSWMRRWGIIDGQRMEAEAWWLDGFESPSNPIAFAIVPMIPEELLKPSSDDTTSP